MGIIKPTPFQKYVHSCTIYSIQPYVGSWWNESHYFRILHKFHIVKKSTLNAPCSPCRASDVHVCDSRETEEQNVKKRENMIASAVAFSQINVFLLF